MRERREENWRTIESWRLEEPKERLLIGEDFNDFNARLGQEGGWIDEENNKDFTRESEDNKKIDNAEEGTVENLRNMENINGDETGKLTYFGPKGIRYYE